MPNRKIAPSSYREIVANIVRIYDNARRSLVEAHWEIGERIVKIEQDGASRAAYGAGLLPQISLDLTRERGTGFSLTNLKRFRQFYLSHPKGAPAHLLTWAHHMELLSVRDGKKRRRLERQATDRGLNRDELRDMIRSEKGTEEIAASRTIDVTLLAPKKGTPDLYQVRSAEDIGWPDKKALLFDHGFKCYSVLSPDEARGLTAGDIVEGIAEISPDPSFQKSGAGLPPFTKGDQGGFGLPEYSLKKSGAAKPGYTYTAYLEKGVDGDTFWVVLDIGLGSVSRQKLRLRGIDCPELPTPEGKAAKKFVEMLLKDAPSLTVRSSKNDKYDRYEADVYFVGPDGREIYLNNLLLEQGHAVRMKC